MPRQMKRPQFPTHSRTSFQRVRRVCLMRRMQSQRTATKRRRKRRKGNWLKQEIPLRQVLLLFFQHKNARGPKHKQYQTQETGLEITVDKAVG